MQQGLRRVAVIGCVALASVGSAIGCGSSFTCARKGMCPNDPTPTSADIAACQSEEAGACGAQFLAARECVHNTPVCNAAGITADGGSDPCNAEVEALTRCCVNNRSAAGCSTF